MAQGLQVHSSCLSREGPEVIAEVDLVNVYKRHGGVLSGDELVRTMRDHQAQPMSLLARRIVERRMVCFACHSQTYIPSFQFASKPVELLSGVQAVLLELVPALDDYALAHWFAMPNCWLQFKVPAVLVARDPLAVLQAARADRYVARGW